VEKTVLLLQQLELKYGGDVAGRILYDSLTYNSWSSALKAGPMVRSLANATVTVDAFLGRLTLRPAAPEVLIEFIMLEDERIIDRGRIAMGFIAC